MTMAVVVVAGILGRRLPGLAGDAVGGLLYAGLLYLMLAYIGQRRRALELAVAAAGIGVAIELVQLTGLPAALAAVFSPSRLVLGSVFVPLDLAFAVVGAALATLTDLVTRRSVA